MGGVGGWNGGLRGCPPLRRQAMVLAPYILVAPRLFADQCSERITLGTLVQTSNSFDKVFASLSVFDLLPRQAGKARRGQGRRAPKPAVGKGTVPQSPPWAWAPCPRGRCGQGHGAYPVPCGLW